MSKLGYIYITIYGCIFTSAMVYSEREMVSVKCENGFCVYEYEGSCLLDHIELDSQGQCKECVYIHIEKEDLQKAKKQLLHMLGDGLLMPE